MPDSLSGGCLCGAVRYECSADPLISAVCHCNDCRKSFGGVVGTSMAIPANALSVTGELTYFDTVADSGNTVSRGFCPTCGSPVVATSSGMPDLKVISAGTLDEPDRFAPQMRVFEKRAPSWVHLPQEMPSFADMPADIPQAS